MKTWHQSLANLLNKTLLAGALGLSLSSYAQSGFYTDFQTLIEIQKTNFSQKFERYAAEPSKLEDIKDPLKAELDPDFLSSIIFNTPGRYAGLGGADKCGLYDLVLSNLAQGPNGDIEIFLVRYENNEGKIVTTAASRKDFFEKIAFKQCPQVERFQKYFGLKNLPTTLKNLSLLPPSGQAECEESHSKMRLDPKTPYLCYLSEEIQGISHLENQIRKTSGGQYRKLRSLRSKLKAAKQYEKLVSPAAQSYLVSLCENIDSKTAFCEGFFKSNFWTRVVQGEKSKHYMESSCQQLKGKNQLNKRDYESCAAQFANEPDLCSELGNLKGDLTPKPGCDELSANLNLSRLKADYEDCPAKVGNAGIVNITRLIAHFSGKAPPKSDFCHASITAMFAEFDLETSEGRAWDVRLCYDDKINQREVCLPAVYGNVKDSDLSMSSVVEKILRKTKGLGADQSCRLTSKKGYRPELLEFKSGCFVIVDFENCYGTSCEYEVLLNQKKITHIRKKSGTQFDYFPKDFATENFAISEQFVKKYKLKSSRVLNVSTLKRVLNENKEAVIHGIGCAEDLLPGHFSKKRFNECRPLPFIIDGYKENDGLYSVIIRTAYDSLHAPRLVPWTNLFSALKDYQRIHPLNVWGLYALRK